MILYPEVYWEADMARVYGVDLRRRVVEAIAGELSARSAAARFSIGISTAILWHRQWREHGTVEAGRQGQPKGSKLDDHEVFILALVEEEKDIALHEIAEKLAAERGVQACASTVCIPMKTASHSDGKRPPIPIENGHFGRGSIWAA
jgi:transposase